MLRATGPGSSYNASFLRAVELDLSGEVATENKIC